VDNGSLHTDELADCCVLVVEDDADLREMMVQMLALEGFDAASAVDGLDALEKLRTSACQPHVILLDMMMPRMNGWEFCRQRALDAAARDIPIVVLSAAPRDSITVDAAAVIPKPFDYQTLLTTIRRHC
jgi:CheY-like chemotaxis protein